MAGGTFALAGGLQASSIDAGESPPILTDADAEAGAMSECGRGVEEALPLLLIGLVGLYAVARRRA